MKANEQKFSVLAAVLAANGIKEIMIGASIASDIHHVMRQSDIDGESIVFDAQWADKNSCYYGKPDVREGTFPDCYRAEYKIATEIVTVTLSDGDSMYGRPLYDQSVFKAKANPMIRRLIKKSLMSEVDRLILRKRQQELDKIEQEARARIWQELCSELSDAQVA